MSLLLINQYQEQLALKAVSCCPYRAALLADVAILPAEYCQFFCGQFADFAAFQSAVQLQ